MEKIYQAVFFGMMLLMLSNCEQNPNKSPKSEAMPQFSLTPEQRAESHFCSNLRTETPNASEQEIPRYFSREFIQEHLNAEGLSGWMHGVVAELRHFIFTYRDESDDPMAFFRAEEFSLISRDPEVSKVLGTLKRHDRVRLKGEVLDNGSPLLHINVTSIEIEQVAPELPAYDRSQGLAFYQALQSQERVAVLGKVHTVLFEGQGILFEHQGVIFPIQVAEQHRSSARRLFRNDKVLVHVRVHNDPHRPLHFSTDTEIESAIETIDAMVDCHNIETSLEGYLVRYKQSPQINRDVYAVKIRDANGIERNFTFFPDVEIQSEQDGQRFQELFNALSVKAEAAWNEYEDHAEADRNHSFNPKLQVRVQGRLNIVSPTQANPQVMISDEGDLSISKL